jgi:hypothetical protein
MHLGCGHCSGHMAWNLEPYPMAPMPVAYPLALAPVTHLIVDHLYVEVWTHGLHISMGWGLAPALSASIKNPL